MQFLVVWFGPMSGERVSWFGLPAALVLVAGAGVALIVAFLWIRHIVDPDELTRGEARWRYRDRGDVLELDLLDDARIPDRTGGWWATRIEFAVAIAVLAFTGWVFLAQVGDPRAAMLLLPSGAGLVGVVVGIVAMVRIYRAGVTGDSRSTWRSGSRG